MKLRVAAFAAALVVVAAALAPAWGASTINPTLPIAGQPYSSAPIRNNFQAAANDVNALQSMNAGATAPSAPSLGTLWLNTPQSATVDPLSFWDGTHWAALGALDTVNHVWMPPIGGGVVPNILSAATTDVGAVPQASVYVTGSNSISSLGATAAVGTIKTLLFTGAAQLVYNSSSLILPGAASVTQSPGDTALALALGAGNWQVLFDSAIGNGNVIGPTASTAPDLATWAGGKNISDSGLPWPSIVTYGAKLNGTNDDGPAINACLVANNICFVPPSTAGAYINTGVVIPAGKTLRGYSWAVQNGSATAAFAGQSWLLCSNSVTRCVSTNGAALFSGAISHLIISGVSGTPTSGTVGLFIPQGYNLDVDHVAVYNRDTCVEFQSGGTGGISAQLNDPTLGGCQTHYLTVDGWPELKVFGGRFGMNGAGDYPATDYVYLTNTGCTGAGCGPNTISFFGTQFNTGTAADGPTYWLHMANIAAGAPMPSEIKADSVHVEVLATGGAVIGTDSSVTTLKGLQITNSWFSQDNSGVNFFALNSATALLNSNLSCNQLFVGGFTLSPNPASGDGLSGDEFIGNTFGAPATFTTNKNLTDSLEVVGNHFLNSLTYTSATGSDQWFSLLSVGNTVDSAGTSISGAVGHIIVLDGTNSQNMIVSSMPPTQAAPVNTAGSTVTIANGANAALPVMSGPIYVDDLTSGQVGEYLCGGGGCSLVGTPGSEWVTSTTTPASGKASIDASGSNTYNIYNNTGASVLFSVGLWSICNGT